jgi:hypothetical protein
MSLAAQRQFDRRRFGVMKKANELKLRFGAQVAVFILQEGQHWAYQSDDNWPPEMQNTVLFREIAVTYWLTSFRVAI